MDGKYSVYSVAESNAPQWKHGEDLAAAATVGVTFWLVFETQIEILRAFKQWKGLYFWSIQLGIWGVASDNIGICLKYFARDIKHLWPLDTLCVMGGWSIYTTAQLLVLYSRLHLVCRNQNVQRTMLWMPVVAFVLFQIPTWVCVWPAYADIPRISSVWSPREAIMERFNQLGYTLAEVVISGTYIKCLLELLKIKSSVRQRRVMLDLIYVNVIVVCLDFIEIILIWLNINAIAHPVQTFSYIVKFRLEFVILNQLMAVAARGLYRENPMEKRYHHPSTENAFWGRPLQPASSQPPQWSDEKSPRQAETSKATSASTIQIPLVQQTALEETGSTGSAQICIPSPSHQRDRKWSGPLMSHSKETAKTIGNSEALSNDDSKSLPRIPSQDSSSTILPIQSPTDLEDDHHHNHHSRFNPLSGLRARGQHRSGQDSVDGEKAPMKPRVRHHIPKHDQSDTFDEEGEIALHLWERRGQIVLEVPWLSNSGGLSTSSQLENGR